VFERKLALRAHESQTAHRDRLAEEMRERLTPSQAAGLPTGRLAEAFRWSRSPSLTGSFSLWFRRHARAAGLPAIRLHDMRHAYATAGLAAGVPPR
jgi:integrase